MNFQIFVLVFAVVIATNIHCQAKPQLEDSQKSPAVNGQGISGQQVKKCTCNGRRNVVEQNCVCEQQRQHRNKGRALCLKKGASKKCKQIIEENMKQKKNKGISTPI